MYVAVSGIVANRAVGKAVDTVRAALYPIIDCPVGRLGIMPRPRGGDWLEGEALSWREQGLDVVVSLLTDDEMSDLGLAEEETSCESAGLRFLRFPIADRGLPHVGQAVTDLVTELLNEL
jgi:hypothetical protein